MTDLSIIIVTYNPGGILLDCLRSIAAGVGNLSHEVVVVDNASQDEMVGRAAALFPEARFVLNADNRGFAGGNNQGLALAAGRYLLLMNPDVVVEPGSLAALVEFLEQRPEVGIVGPRTLSRQGDLSLTAHAPYHAGTILWQYLGLNRLLANTYYGRYRRASQSATEPFRVAWVQACCLLLRREVYQGVGGLDEGFFLFAEDPDLCERAARAGWATYFLPTAQVVHLESAIVSRYHERRIRSYHLSPLYYFRKRGQEGQVILLKLGFTVELALKLAIRLAQRLRGRDAEGRLWIYSKVLGEVWRY